MPKVVGTLLRESDNADAFSGGSGLSDGDKSEVKVTETGTKWQLNRGVVSTIARGLFSL